jgi:hypothetical protein
MIPSNSISLFLLAALLSTCSCHQRINPVQLAMLSSTLDRANKNIYDENERIYNEIAQSFSGPERKMLAMRWAPTTLQVLALSQSAKSSIDSLQLELVNTHKLSLGEQDKLFNVLIAYRQNIQHIFNADSVGLSPDRLKVDTAGINRTLPILYGYSDAVAKEYSKNWTDSIFGSDEEQMTMAALKKVKNDVSLSENRLISYCYKNIDLMVTDASATYPIAWQSAIHVKAGDSLDINAGIGTSSRLAKTAISIDGLPTPLNESELAVRTIKVGNKPGRHTVPVVIKYINPDGSTSQMTKMLVYYVQN